MNHDHDKPTFPLFYEKTRVRLFLFVLTKETQQVTFTCRNERHKHDKNTKNAYVGDSFLSRFFSSQGNQWSKQRSPLLSTTKKKPYTEIEILLCKNRTTAAHVSIDPTQVKNWTCMNENPDFFTLISLLHDK